LPGRKNPEFRIINSKLNGQKTIAGFDVGTNELDSKNSTRSWTVWTLIHQIPLEILNRKSSFGIRLEGFRDPYNLNVASNSSNNRPFKVLGVTPTFNYNGFKDILLRLEGRYLSASDPIFPNNRSSYKRENLLLVQSMSVSF